MPDYINGDLDERLYHIEEALRAAERIAINTRRKSLLGTPDTPGGSWDLNFHLTKLKELADIRKAENNLKYETAVRKNACYTCGRKLPKPKAAKA